MKNTKSYLNSFKNGDATDAYNFFGCHREGDGYVFRVWAPNAKTVRLAGDFNDWKTDDIYMLKIGQGVWEARCKNAKVYDNYKYLIESQNGKMTLKSDPFAFHSSTRPENASTIYDIDAYQWTDSEYIKNKQSPFSSPMNIYEVHLGSWRKYADGNFLNYRDIARQLGK